MNKQSPEKLEKYIQKLETIISQQSDELKKVLADKHKYSRDILESDMAPKGPEDKLNIITHSTNIFYSHTIDHQITYISPQSLDIIGYTPQEAMVKWTSLVSDNPINEEGYRKTCEAIETGVPQKPYELELINKSGEKVWVEVREAPVVVDGKTVSIVGSLTDITEKKKAENSIKYHLSLETAVAEASKLFITSHDVDVDKMLETIGRAVLADRAYIFRFDENLRIMSNTHEWCNEDTEPQIDNLQNIETNMVPWWMEKLTNHETIIIDDLNSIPAKYVNEKEILEAQNIQSLIVVPVILNDKTLWGFLGFDDTKSTRDWGENEIGILTVISDMISRYIDRERNEEVRQHLEKQLFQSQKMESIGRLAGGIAHDFNNTLTSIMGYAEMLKLRHSDADTFESEAADVILENTKRAADLTRQLLGFARGGKYVPIPININEIITETSRLTGKSLSKSIKVFYNLAENLKPVKADRSQMEQVLTNLIINARDAMPTVGILTLETENVYLSESYDEDGLLRTPGEYVKFSVIDTGIGIPEDLQQKVFEPFFTTKDIGEGAGLGLATVYGIVKNHHGYVELFSETGNGTRVSVYLPVTKDCPVAEEGHETSEMVKGNGETILVVDDEEKVRVVTRLQLQKLGYRVILAQSGDEAVSIYRKRYKKISLVLLDVVMPDMDGLETFKKLRDINPDIKAIVISGFTKKGKASELLAMGAHAFIQKPFQSLALSKAISEALT